MNNNQQIIFANKPTQNSLGDGYLKFQLNQQTAAILAMAHTQEAMVLSIESITPMPNMPGCILGLMNWRSRVIWAIDLPRMLNLEAIDTRMQQYNVIVIKVESLLLGLVVQQIKGITKVIADDIHSPIGQVASSLVPYLRGCVVQEEEILLVLDAQAILQSSILRSD